jgi:hypothetical protein
MNRLLPRVVLTVLACLALAAPTRADFVNWSYSTSPGTPTVTADGSSPVGYVKLAGDGSVSASGSSDIVLASLSAFSSVNPLTPESFTARPWSVSLTITDSASHASATLTFTGTFGGTLSSLSSNITNAFTGSTTQSVTLGSNTYVVTANSYVPPSVPNALNTGAIGAHVNIRSGGVPEPSSLLLCGLGAAGWALTGYRRRRARR